MNRKRAYLVLMGTCLTLFVLPWRVVRLYSTTAAAAISAVAAVMPPVAEIAADHGRSGGRSSGTTRRLAR